LLEASHVGAAQGVVELFVTQAFVAASQVPRVATTPPRPQVSVSPAAQSSLVGRFSMQKPPVHV